MCVIPHSALAGMTSNPKTGVVSRVRRLTVILEKFQACLNTLDLSDIKTAVFHKLNSNINRFYPDAGGIIMGYQDIKIKNSFSEIKSILHPVQIKAKFFLFIPLAGEDLLCVVTSKEEGEIKCTANGVFNVEVINKDLDELYVGQMVVVRVEAVEQMSWQEPRIVGSLVPGEPFIDTVETLDTDLFKQADEPKSVKLPLQGDNLECVSGSLSVPVKNISNSDSECPTLIPPLIMSHSTLLPTLVLGHLKKSSTSSTVELTDQFQSEHHFVPANMVITLSDITRSYRDLKSCWTGGDKTDWTGTVHSMVWSYLQSVAPITAKIYCKLYDVQQLDFSLLEYVQFYLSGGCSTLRQGPGGPKSSPKPGATRVVRSKYFRKGLSKSVRCKKQASPTPDETTSYNRITRSNSKRIRCTGEILNHLPHTTKSKSSLSFKASSGFRQNTFMTFMTNPYFSDLDCSGSEGGHEESYQDYLLPRVNFTIVTEEKDSIGKLIPDLKCAMRPQVTVKQVKRSYCKRMGLDRGKISLILVGDDLLDEIGMKDDLTVQVCKGQKVAAVRKVEEVEIVQDSIVKGETNPNQLQGNLPGKISTGVINVTKEEKSVDIGENTEIVKEVQDVERSIERTESLKKHSWKLWRECGDKDLDTFDDRRFHDRKNNLKAIGSLANPRPVKSVKKMPSMSDITLEKIMSSCDICNKELNSVEELQVHIKERHSDDDGKYFSDDDNSPNLDSSPDDPNLKCVECNTQYKKTNQFENHTKKRHGGIKHNIETTNKLAENKSDAWDEFEDDMEDFEEEELGDEFLEDIAPKTVETHKLEPNKILTNGNDKIINPAGKTENSWYASVHQIIQRFRLQDYQTPLKIGSMEKYRDKARFVEYIAPLLRSVNLRAKTSTLFILAKAKWFELMQSKGVTTVKGSLTNLRKPRKIVVNTL